jgi:hypothetical protein
MSRVVRAIQEQSNHRDTEERLVMAGLVPAISEITGTSPVMTMIFGFSVPLCLCG